MQLQWRRHPSSLSSINIRPLVHGSTRFSFPRLFNPSTFHISIHKPPFLLHTHYLNTHFIHLSPPLLLPSMLYSCNDLQTLKKTHAFLIVANAVDPISVTSKLIYLYSQFGESQSAISVFETVPEPNSLIFNIIMKAQIDGYSAFTLYRRMRKLGIENDVFTFPILNSAVLLLRDTVFCGGMIHCSAMKMGFESNLYFCNTLMDLYVKCGYLGCARQLFEEMPLKDLVSWTSLISGYAYEGNISGAFDLFHKMRLELDPSAVTVLVLLKLCCSYGSVMGGKQLHGYVTKKGFSIEGSLQNSILKLYADLGSLDDTQIFLSEIGARDVVSWNILISSYISRGDFAEVVKCFDRMQNQVKPSIETLTLVISACAKHGNLSQGKKLHSFAIKIGYYDHVLQTSLLDFYAKCGDLEKSAQMFREVTTKNSITWSAMMSGLVEGGHFQEAADLYRQMKYSGLSHGVEILRNIVVMYTHLGALKLGKGVHARLIKSLSCNSNEDDTSLHASILNMYIRCGSIAYAKLCFDRVVNKDTVTWTSMIDGCGAHGLGTEALQLFDQMVEEGILPNSVTFLSLLSACSHSGLLIHGCQLFYTMKWRFGIEPDLNHYTSLVDLLGRFGKLKEGLALILKFVAFPDSRIWGALVSASRVYENQQIVGYAAERLLELEPDNAGYYTLLSNVEAVVERWDEVEKIRGYMKENCFIKKPGWSCIEAKGVIHGFVSGDRTHPLTGEIYEMLTVLSRKVLQT